MDVVCEVCGAVGFKHLLVQCNNCKDSTRHRYCMYTVVYDEPSIEWLCDDCVPKCNEPVESLEAFSNQREQNHIQLDPSMNSMEGLDLSKEKARCCPPKHVEELSPQGTNSDSFPLINDVERYHRCVTDSSFSILPSMEQTDRSSHMAESVEQPHPLEVIKPDGSDNSALDPAIESKGNICFENATGNFGPTLNSILPSVEQADGSCDMAESVEQPYHLGVAKPDGSDHSALDPALENIGFENAADTSEPTLSSMEWLDLSKEKDSCICSLNVAVICKKALQTEGVNSELFPPETVSPCKETKISSEKQQNRSNKPGRHLCENLNSKIIRNVDPAQFKSGRSSKHLGGHTYSSASSKVKDVQYVNAATRCSNAAKRKGLVLQYSNDKDAEALQVEDLNQPFENDGQVKKHMTHVENGVMNQTISVENCAEAVRPGTSNNQYVNNYTQAKNQKSIKTNDAGNEILGDPSAGCFQNDTAQLASQYVLAGDHCSVSRMPVISAPTDQQCYIPTQPIDKPCWTGIMKIGPEYVSLAAHLSNKACKKVQELSRSLPPVMEVMEHPELKAWPSRWEESEPIAESIALYFFPDNTRPNKDLDRLMQYVTNHSIVLKYTVGFANLLILPSVFLPEKFQMLQGKHFLWGVFKREMVRSKGDPPVKKTEVAKKRKDKQDKVQVDTLDQEKSVPQMEKQDCKSQFAKKRKDQQDKMQVGTLDQGKPVPSVKKQGCTSQIAKKRKDQQEKVQVDTLDQENLVSKHNIPNGNQPSPDTVNGVNFVQTLSMALTKPGDDGKARSSSEAQAPMLFGHVDARTPRSQRDLRLNLKEIIRSNLVALKKG